MSISSHCGGTRIEMTCSYGMAPENSDRDGDEPGDKPATVVIGHDGSHTRLATWVALAGHRKSRRKHVDAARSNRSGTNRFR